MPEALHITYSEQVQPMSQPRYLHRLLLNARELAVLDMNAIDIVFIRHSDNKHTKVTLIAGDMLQPYIAHRWRIVAAALLFVVIVEVYLQDRFATPAYLNVTDKDILRNASPARVRLYADDAVKILRVHVAVLYKDIPGAGCNLRADDHATVAVLHATVPDNDILRGTSVGSSVLVPSALYGYAVITRMERATLYQHTVATLWVATIAIRSLIPYFHVADRYVLAEERMDNPER